MVAKQFIKLSPRHPEKIVTVVVKDTHFRVLHGEGEIAVRPRKSPEPVARLYVKGKGSRHERQTSVDDKTLSSS